MKRIRFLSTVPGLLLLGCLSAQLETRQLSQRSAENSLQASSPTQWRNAPRPNYSTNEDLDFPYSELPFEEDYYVYQLKSLIEADIFLVDFWGEGRITTAQGVSGFNEAYNINHQYQLVSNGLDYGRKIPNRIPVSDHSDVDVSKYVGDDCVTNITVMGAPIIQACADEIARMIRKDFGVVIAYGFSRSDYDIVVLESALRLYDIIYYPNYPLHAPFDEITLFDSYLVYVNANHLVAAANSAIDGEGFAQAKALLQSLHEQAEFTDVSKVIAHAAESYRLFPLGYALVSDAATSGIVAEYFPVSAREIILLESPMSITNVDFNMPLKLGWKVDGEGDRTAFGGDAGRGIEPSNKNRFCWKFEPIENGRYFSITNVDFNMPLKLGWKVDGQGDRTAYGGDAGRGIEPSNANRFYWQLSPIDGGTSFSITNRQFNMPLKVGWKVDGQGDRTAYGGDAGRGIEPSNKTRFYWTTKRQ